MTIRFPLLSMLLAVAMTGCASDKTVYTTGMVNLPLKTYRAKVIEAKDVTIEGKAVGGAQVGAMSGAMIGGGGHGWTGAGVGLLAGAVTGAVVDQVAKHKSGVEITYLPEGSTEQKVLVQEASTFNPIRAGDTVKITESQFQVRAERVGG